MPPQGILALLFLQKVKALMDEPRSNSVYCSDDSRRRTGYRDPNCLSALSAACAEVGLYGDAVAAARQAVAVAEAGDDADFANELRRRLRILESGHPLHP